MRELPGRRSTAILGARIGARIEQRADGSRAAIADRAVQWHGPILVGGVWLSAELDQAKHGFPLSGGIPSRRTRAAVNRVVQRLGAAAVESADRSATINEFTDDIRLEGCRGNVQSAVAAVHVVLNLCEEVGLTRLSAGTDGEARQHDIRCT